MHARALILLCVTFTCYAQQDVPTFRAGTTLVEFTVVALDSKGKPVTDLKREEIQLTERGQTRPLAFFRFEGEAVAGAPQPLPPHIYSNRTEYTAGAPRNVTAILLDALNTPLQDQMSARDQAIDYLRTLAPGTRVAVYWLGAELRVVQGFTGSSGSLSASISGSFKKLPLFVSQDVMELDCLAFPDKSPGPCVGVRIITSAETKSFQALAERRKSLTLAGLEALGDQLAGIPGRKSLIWIGGGIPIVSMTGAFLIGDVHTGFKSYETEIRKTAQRLATQGVSIYPVDSKGLIRGTVPPRAKPSVTTSLLSNYMPESTNDAMAELTGGRVVKWTNQLSRGMELAENDQRGSYSLGFYAVGEPDNSWHNLALKTTRRDVKLTYRQGYVAEAAAPQPVDWTEPEWRAALANPISSTAVHLDARFEPIVENGKHGLLLQIQASDLLFRKTADVQIAIADKTLDGGFSFRVDTVQLDLTGDKARYAHSWQLAPGTTTVRLIVRDRSSGRYGTLDLPVK